MSVTESNQVVLNNAMPVEEDTTFERVPNFRVDVAKLRHHLFENVIPKFPPIMQGANFGGWSIYSSNGHYDDGWHQGHRLYKEVDGKQVYDRGAAIEQGILDSNSYRVPTEICYGYLAVVMCKISALWLWPRRARLSLVNPGGATSWHRDAEDDEYGLRLHIPIVTNDQCWFDTRSKRYFMPADGSAYLVKVNREHQAVNFGSEVRYHMIMEVWDKRGISKYQKYVPGAYRRRRLG